MFKISSFQGITEYKQPKRNYLRKSLSVPREHERSRISTFSASSRKRLHRECLKILFTQDFYFVTLTYQASALDLGEKEVTWKQDLQKLRLRLIRSLPNLSAIWKLEFTKSGLPHYHLITHCPDIGGTQLRNVVRGEWLKIIGSGSRGRYRHAVKVDPVGNMKAVSRYLSKYVSKDANDFGQIHCGRYWGYFNKKDFPSGTLQEFELNEIQMQYFRRVLSCIYVSPKFYDVQANLHFTENSFAVYIPFACQKVILDPLFKK
jgi:hypothetical protein